MYNFINLHFSVVETLNDNFPRPFVYIYIVINIAQIINFSE